MQLLALTSLHHCQKTGHDVGLLKSHCVLYLHSAHCTIYKLFNSCKGAGTLFGYWI